ncbi:MAG: mobilization protein BmgB [Segetibacter sp.]|nr:mobilization protein BmgB [Segetibacter sp.]
MGRLSEVFWASGVVVEQKPVRPTQLAFNSRWSLKENNLQTLETDKKSEMETVRENEKPGGRPAKIIKKNIRTAIRFSKTEDFIVRQKALKAGLKVSVYIRQIAIEGVVANRLSEEERHFVRQLIGISNNINQLAKNSHLEGMLKTMLYFESLRNEIDLILKKLNHGE